MAPAKAPVGHSPDSAAGRLNRPRLVAAGVRVWFALLLVGPVGFVRLCCKRCG